MRKYMLRIFTAMLVVCLGAAVFAACTDPETPSETTKYTVTYVAGGGEGTAPASASYEEGATFTVAANTFTREGYTFSAWNDGTEDVAAGATYTMPAKNVTFTALWTENGDGPETPVNYTVTYSLGEYTEGTAPAAETVASGTEVTLPTAPAWEGYTFLGWKVGDATELKQAGDKITVTADVTVTAQWEENGDEPIETPYTVNFASEEEGVTLPESLNYAEGATFFSHAGWTAATATKENYAFLYWYYLNGEEQVKVTETSVVSDIAVEGVVTLYPAFDLTKIVYGNYEALGNWAVPTMFDMTIQYGQVVTYTGNITFTGWWHMVAAVVSNYADGSVYSVNRFNDAFFLNKTLEEGSQGATAARNNDLGMYFFFTSNVSANGQNFGSSAEWINPNYFKDYFLNVSLDDYKIVVDYTDATKIVATVTFSAMKDDVKYVFTNVSTYTSTDPHGTGLDQFYYLGIAGDGIGLNNVVVEKTGAIKELPAVEADHVWADGVCALCGAMSVTFEGYTGTLEKVANYENYDRDWNWWNGTTSEYSLTGDFQTVISWDNFLDTGVCNDIIFEMNAGGDYFDLSPFNVYGEWSVGGGKDCWGTLVPGGDHAALPCTTWGTDPNASGSATKWCGHYQLTVTRIGTTLTISGAFTPWGEAAATYGLTYTVENFTAVDLLTRLTGNPAPCNNFVAYYGQLTATQA